MREPLSIPPVPFARPRQGGYSLVMVLGLLMVLAILGSTAFRSVHNDMVYSSMEVKRVRADFLAESAINWALVEVAKDSGTLPGTLPYTRSTHSNTGEELLPDRIPGGVDNARKILAKDVDAVLPGAILVDDLGFIYQRNYKKIHSITGAKEERLAFKVWYPDDYTVRITGIGIADDVESTVNFKGDLEDLEGICPP